MSKKLVLNDGDAVLVVRSDGTIQLAVPGDEPAQAPTIIVIGLALALENEGWRRGLIERTKQRMAELGVSEDVRGANQTVARPKQQ